MQIDADRLQPTVAEDIVESFKQDVLRNLKFRLAKDRYSATQYDRFLSVAYAVQKQAIEQWLQTQVLYHDNNPKRVYYLSMEFLLGRTLSNAALNLGLDDAVRQGLADFGVDIDELHEEEADAGLGNGGLGRLAACFLDSMATMGIPCHGYGIRYNYGLFRQKIVNGEQVEAPDDWLARTNPWEIMRPEYEIPIRFGGHLENRATASGESYQEWVGGMEIRAMPYDIPIPGYGTPVTNTLRLWSSHAAADFNLETFNAGDYMAASRDQVESEELTKILYPNDMFFVGKELRLKQEYFLVSSSVQDIVRRFKASGEDWSAFPDRVAIQLNDTHPALAIPELMRILIDKEGLGWEQAWEITQGTFAYTNHTILPEALEEWPVDLLGAVLPRHLDIIYRINYNFLQEVAWRYPGDVDRLRRMSIVAEDGVKRIRMAYLATVGSHAVNGVAALHTRLLREGTILHDFDEFWPGKISNKTNGISPRRWLAVSNPPLAKLITEAIGDGWLTDLEQLRNLEAFAGDVSFRERWERIQRESKLPIVDLVAREHNVVLSPDSLFDVQVKRIHEYKRQVMFALYAIATYLRIKDDPNAIDVPRTLLFAGKSAPGYRMAKMTIQLINAISRYINGDPDTKDLLRVVFLPNYGVSLAERIIPAADLSEQISTAGMEASGTSNMKFVLNGALIIGTLDGANVEIRNEVGEDAIFIFGKTADEINAMRAQGYHPAPYIATSPLLQRILFLLEHDTFCPDNHGLFHLLYNELVNYDRFFIMADFEDYLACQDRVSQTYLDTELWTKLSIRNVARSGKFSSDRTIGEYARDIWHTTAIEPSAFDVYATPASVSPFLVSR